MELTGRVVCPACKAKTSAFHRAVTNGKACDLCGERGEVLAAFARLFRRRKLALAFCSICGERRLCVQRDADFHQCAVCAGAEFKEFDAAFGDEPEEELPF